MDGGLLNQVLQDFVTTIQTTWGPLLQLYMLRVLLLLVVLQCAIIFADVLMTHDATRLLDHLVTGCVRVGICWVIFIHAGDWGQAIIDFGSDVGRAVSTLSTGSITPSAILNTGLNLAHIIWTAKATGGWLSAGIQDLEFFFVSMVIIAAWTGAALIYLGALLEAAALVYGGPLLIAFTPFAWTAELLVRWALSVLGIAIKIAVLLMTLAIGMAIARVWTEALALSSATLTTNLWNLMVAAVESLIFVYLLMKIPTAIASLVGGGGLFAFGEGFLAQAMGALGGAAASAGSATASAAGSAASSVASGVGGLGHVSRTILFGDNGGGGAGNSSSAPAADAPTQKLS
jgi:type IV secretion system protein TrbL